MKLTRKCAFTLIELLVVVAVTATLAAIIAPAFISARRASKSAGCQSNLHQQHLALLGYTEDYDGSFPRIYFSWVVDPNEMSRDTHESLERKNPMSYPNVFHTYTKTNRVFECPADFGAVEDQDFEMGIREGSMFDRFGTSYRPAAELGDYGLALSDIPDPGSIFWSADGTGYWHSKYHRMLERGMNKGDGYDTNRWQMNAVFLDGHVKISPFSNSVWGSYLSFLSTLSRPGA